MIAADFKAGVIDRDEARVALGYESKAEYRGKFAGAAKGVKGESDNDEAVKAFEPNRGKTTPGTNSGSFAPGGSRTSRPGGSRTSPPKLTPEETVEIGEVFRVGKAEQRFAEEQNQAYLAGELNGKPQSDDLEMDILLFDETNELRHGIELKSVLSPKSLAKPQNFKIRMQGSARLRKQRWENRNDVPVHTVVFDDRRVFNANGHGRHDTSKREIYYRRGIGNFFVPAMHKVKSIEELKILIDTADDKLPPAAQRIDRRLP